MSDFDLIIVGGGVVGLTLAGLLADSRLKILLLDHENMPVTGLQTPADIRVSAINHASLAIFQSLKIWKEMEALRVSAYDKMRVWDAHSAAEIEFAAFEVGQTFLGHIIEHNVMRQVLWQLLLQKSNIMLQPKTQITKLTEHKTHITLQLGENNNISAKLVVGADGGNSWVAQQTQLTKTTRSYQQSALVATIHTQKPHQKTCLERFIGQHQLAFLPLLDPHLVSIVWSTTPQHAKHLQAIEAQEFNNLLTVESDHVLGKVQLQGDRQVFPLIEKHAQRYVKPRIALIGDAAHTMHPLAGQGVNLGLLDAACLAEVITEAHKNNLDIGALHHLRRYERWRKGDNTLMLAAMRAFKNFFSLPLRFAAPAKTLSLKLTHHLPFTKSFFMRRAMGLHNDLPKSAVFWSEI